MSGVVVYSCSMCVCMCLCVCVSVRGVGGVRACVRGVGGVRVCACVSPRNGQACVVYDLLMCTWQADAEDVSVKMSAKAIAAAAGDKKVKKTKAH
jgi:hypothetical protein